MPICIYVCMYVYIACMHCMYVVYKTETENLLSVRMRAYVFMYVCSVCMYCMYVCIYLFVSGLTFSARRNFRVLLRLVRRDSVVFIFHHRFHGGLQHCLLAGIVKSGSGGCLLSNDDGAIILISSGSSLMVKLSIGLVIVVVVEGVIEIHVNKYI